MADLTHVGGPTVLLELGGWRILTDPTFDPPGRRYGFGWGTASTKTIGPALEADELGRVDVVLLSHDQHADNLDDAGRALLPVAGTVVTTLPGARHLASLADVRGLADGTTTTLEAPGKEALTIRATPCRHGPPLSRPVVGAVTGFALTLGADPRVAVWITGDTVLNRQVRRTARELRPDILVMHLGGVRFPISGPVRYTMDSADAVELIGLSRPRVAVPVHYDAWSHFAEPVRDLRTRLSGADAAVRDCVRWLEPGRSSQL